MAARAEWPAALIYPATICLGSIMSAIYLEIIELATGEIVLRRSDEEDAEPLVRLSFSDELQHFLEGDQFEIARVMLNSCIEEISRKTDMDAVEYVPEHRVLH